jgi:hypothetical protein
MSESLSRILKQAAASPICNVLRSNFEPICGTAGCFAGLISIVANDIPELKELYAGEKYCFTEWAEALKKFLGISIEDQPCYS